MSVCVSGFHMHTPKIMLSHIHSDCLHRLSLKANNTSSTFVRTMCKSYDILKSHCEIEAQWKTVLSLCTKPLVSQQKDSIRKTECIHELNIQSPLSPDLFRLHQLFNQFDHFCFGPYMAQIRISDRESQFQLISTLKCHGEVSIWNYNQGLFQGQVWNILCCISLITQTEDSSIIYGTYNYRLLFYSVKRFLKSILLNDKAHCFSL